MILTVLSIAKVALNQAKSGNNWTPISGKFWTPIDILPIFALANTGIIFDANSISTLVNIGSLGIVLGLLVGKPLGVAFACYLAVKQGICQLPLDVNWQQIVGAGMLGGIGFTVSIFITNLAFYENIALINAAKMAILLASLGSALLGFAWLSVNARHSQ